MFALVARLIGGAVTPLTDRLTAFGASLVRKLALFVVAAICFLVVLIALTIAFDLWIASLAGPIGGALAVAGVYLVVALTALFAALYGGKTAAATADEDEAEEPTPEESRGARIDQFTAPLLNILQGLGLRREQLAVLAGASVAKQLRPIPLVALAIVAGFLIGRMWKGFDAVLSTDLVARLLALLGMDRGTMDRGTAATDDAPEPEDLAA